MAIVTINDENLTNIASAIRAKNGTEDTYKPSDMAAAISAIQAGGGEVNMVEITFTGSGSNGFTGFNVYDYVDDPADIIAISLRVGADRTSSCNNFTYIKDYCFYIPKETHGDKFSSSAPGQVLGIIANPDVYSYESSSTFYGYSAAYKENPAFGIKQDGTVVAMRSYYDSSNYRFRWTDFNAISGTNTGYFRAWMIYK